MNDIYPQWWDTTVTIFNKFTDKTTQIVRWYKTVVNGCFWKNTGTYLKVDKTILQANSTTCRIRENANFLEKAEWQNVPNDAMSNYFTLSVGDIIIKGDVSDNIDEYITGYRSTDIIKKYEELNRCIVVKNVSINVGGGRNNPHYFVSGE